MREIFIQLVSTAIAGIHWSSNMAANMTAIAGEALELSPTRNFGPKLRLVCW